MTLYKFLVHIFKIKKQINTFLNYWRTGLIEFFLILNHPFGIHCSSVFQQLYVCPSLNFLLFLTLKVYSLWNKGSKIKVRMELLFKTWTNANNLTNFSQASLVWLYSGSQKLNLGHFKTKKSRQREPVRITQLTSVTIRLRQNYKK